MGPSFIDRCIPISNHGTSTTAVGSVGSLPLLPPNLHRRPTDLWEIQRQIQVSEIGFDDFVFDVSLGPLAFGLWQP